MSSSMENKRQHVFTWKLENFSLCKQSKGEFLRSLIFTADSLDKTAWCLKLYPRGEYRCEENYISCFLCRMEDDLGPSEVECEYVVGMSIENDTDFLSKKKGMAGFKRGEYRGWSKFINRDILNNDAYFSKDCIIFKCEITVFAMRPFSENHCLTKIGVDKCSFDWNLKNLKSPSVVETKKITFSKTFRVELSMEVPENDIVIRVRRLENYAISQSALCKITLLTAWGKEDISKRDTKLFHSHFHDNTDDEWEFPTFLRKNQILEEVDKYVENDSITLRCCIAFSNDSVAECMEEEQPCSKSEDCGEQNGVSVRLKEDFKRLYVDKIHTDVKLQAQNETFFAHRAVLSVRSPVFFAMFDKKMTENQNGVVTILDLEAETVNLLLEYVYTGCVKNLDYDRAMELLIAADKYQILSLKDECSMFLSSILSEENVCDVLENADLVQDTVLKAIAVNYIHDEAREILQSEQWKKLAAKNLKLATETICELSTLFTS